MAKDWIGESHLKKGAFTEWAKKHGYGVEDGIPEDAIEAGKRSSNAKVRKMATLAETLKNMGKNN